MWWSIKNKKNIMDYNYYEIETPVWDPWRKHFNKPV